MTINVDDVKILKSQRLTDEDDGGGRATGEAVVDGEVNNLFPDISRLDRTLGRIALRKVFAGVLTENADPYLGAHSIVTQAPADPRVAVLLFNSGSQTDVRSDARSVIEGYVVPSTVAQFELLGDQFAGQRAITGIQRVEARVPEVGDVFQLVAGASSQYVRVQALEPTLEEFIYDYGNGNFVNFTRRRLAITISAPLSAKFPGGQAVPAGTTAKNLAGEDKARVLATQVADSARYYGISPLAADITAGDLSIDVASVYSQLVPSAVKESALVNQIGGARKRFIVPASPNSRTINLTFVQVVAGQSRSFITHGAALGSLSLSINGGVYADEGQGELTWRSGTNSFTRITIDYETGELNAYRASTFTGSASLTYQPAAAVTGQSITGEIEITLASRGFAYTLNLADAKPRPGTLSVSFMALGKWYELLDLGNGELSGEGSGTVDYATGAVSISLNALPDVNTSIIYTYVGQDDDNLQTHVGSGDAPIIRIAHQLPFDGIEAGSVVATVIQGGVSKTLTDNGDGSLGGDAGTGTIAYANGMISLVLNSTPDQGSAIVFDLERADVDIDVPLTGSPDAGGIITGTIPGAPLQPGSVQVRWQSSQDEKVPAGEGTFVGTTQVDYEANDDGAGNWVGFTGSINYSTGAFSLKVEQQYDYTEFYTAYKEGTFTRPDRVPYMASIVQPRQEIFGGTLMVRAQESGATYETQTDSVAAPGLQWDLLPAVGDPIVPGSLILQWGAETYVDRSGILFRGLSTTTNAGTAVGTVDYASGVATLTSYPAGQSGAITRVACLTARAGFSTTDAVFRTPGAPLRPASVQVTVVRADTAAIITATAALNGDINEGIVSGTVDSQTGIVRLRFTTDPGDETGASDVPVIASLLKYNAVVQTSLPMSAELLGLDPVRLPADGRVPIYRDGDVLVIQHTAEAEAAPVAGDTVQLPRIYQAAIEVFDANGAALRSDQYTTDRELGTLTWSDPLLLEDAEGNPLTGPLVIRDRVEHMTVCTEVQITGALGIGSPVPWDMPAGETVVSSAVTWGDLQARVFNWFTQQTWNTGAPNWTDTQQGNSTTAQFNLLNYPVEITNIGSISGKWAIIFTGSTTFNVVEEKLGVLTTGSTGSDCAPINPATGSPYFVIRAAGWGAGWAAGNAVRFNTDACLGPMWVVRTVISGQGTVEDDQFKLQIRGDAD
tara:strand:+ start:11189 stop:14737 length:3549 start_codon:yes stop_codon:yes gene_type:complete